MLASSLQNSKSLLCTCRKQSNGRPTHCLACKQIGRTQSLMETDYRWYIENTITSKKSNTTSNRLQMKSQDSIFSTITHNKKEPSCMHNFANVSIDTNTKCEVTSLYQSRRRFSRMTGSKIKRDGNQTESS